MAASIEVSIKGKTYKLGYGLEVFINLGVLWGLETLEEVNERFQVLSTMGDGPTPLSNLKIIAQIIAAMIEASPENTGIVSASEIMNISMMEFQELAVQLTNGFISNMPQQDPDAEFDEKKQVPKT